MWYKTQEEHISQCWVSEQTWRRTIYCFCPSLLASYLTVFSPGFQHTSFLSFTPLSQALSLPVVIFLLPFLHVLLFSVLCQCPNLSFPSLFPLFLCCSAFHSKMFINSDFLLFFFIISCFSHSVATSDSDRQP